MSELKLRVLFFGATAEVVASRSTLLEMPCGASSGDALSKILEIYPDLGSHKLLFAVNETYVDSSKLLNNGDEFAVFTAVSGG